MAANPRIIVPRMHKLPQEGDASQLFEAISGAADSVAEGGLTRDSLADDPYEANARAELRGSIYNIPQINGAQQFSSPGFGVGPTTQRESTEVDWLVTVQQYPNSNGQLRAILMQVNFGIGQASFVRRVQLPAPCVVPYSFRVTGRYVETALGAIGTGGAIARVGISRASFFRSADFYSWLYVNSGFGASPWIASLGNVPVGAPGQVISQLHVVYKTLGAAAGTPLWPLVFDAAQATVVANGAGSLINLPAVFNVGDDRSYGDDVAPGTIQVVNGVQVILSTTPGNLTNAGAGSIYVEGKLGA